ncbi:MAG TPA: hypothetical protein VN622_06460 [Clostridia bacterium]|nr:hypothetical protein [Clostridia bacterium]
MGKYHSTIPVLFALFLLASLAACSSSPNKLNDTGKTQSSTTQEAKTEATQYETGRNAFQKLYVAARAFAADAKPYRLESAYTEGAPVGQGKAGIWSAQFASASRRAIKAYTWSGLSGEDVPARGISRGTEDTYNPANTSTQVFDVAFLKIDSDAAFTEAQKHGGDKLMKKDPKQPVFFSLDFSPRKSELVWHVIYGTNRNDAKLRVAVNATTGKYIATEH